MASLKRTYLLLIATTFLATTATIAKSQLLPQFFTVSQAQVFTNNLTCSNPSPIRLRTALSGALVSVSCNGAANTTTTDNTGSYRLTLNFPNPTFIPFIILNCRVNVTVPANCTITTFTGRPVTTLRSVLLVYLPFTSAPAVFNAPILTAAV